MENEYHELQEQYKKLVLAVNSVKSELDYARLYCEEISKWLWLSKTIEPTHWGNINRNVDAILRVVERSNMWLEEALE